MRNTLGVSLLAAIVAIPACAESASDDATYDAVAQVFATEAGVRATALADAAATVRGELPDGLVRDDSGVVWGQRDGVTYHYWAGGSTVLAWWDGTTRAHGIWAVRAADEPVAQVTGSVSFETAATSSVRATGHGDALVLVDMPSRLVLGGVTQEIIEVTADDDTREVLVELSFPSAGRALLVLDDRLYDIDLTPPPPILR